MPNIPCENALALVGFLIVKKANWDGLSGRCRARWMVSLVAVYASGRWRGYDLHALTHHLRRTGRGFTLQQLFSIERGQELLVYPQAGSFVRFLRERYGAEGGGRRPDGHRVSDRG